MVFNMVTFALDESFGWHMPVIVGQTHNGDWIDADNNHHRFVQETGASNTMAFIFGLHSFCPVIELTEEIPFLAHTIVSEWEPFMEEFFSFVD